MAPVRYESAIESLHHSPAIEQLEVTTVWTCLSIGTAEMIYEMDRVITSCLEDLLATKLESLDLAARLEHSPFKANLSGELNDTHPVQFSLSALFDGMLKKMQFNCHYHISMQNMDVLMELIMLYVMSLDSIDELEGCATENAVINVGLRPGQDLTSDTVPHATAHVVQRPDFLSFLGLDVMPREGTEIKIVPQYFRGVFNKTNDTYSEIAYDIDPMPSWLEWDDNITGWRGNLPMYSEWRGKSRNGEPVISGGRIGPYAVVNLLRLNVKAVLIERHSSLSVHLKRTVRARLAFKVIPWYAHQNSHIPTDPFVHAHPKAKMPEKIRYGSTFDVETPTLKARNALSPALPRMHIDDHFGLATDKIDFAAVSSQNIQVYHMSEASLGWPQLARAASTTENWHFNDHSTNSSVSNADQQISSTYAGLGHSENAFASPRVPVPRLSGRLYEPTTKSSRHTSGVSTSSHTRSLRAISGRNDESRKLCDGNDDAVFFRSYQYLTPKQSKGHGTSKFDPDARNPQNSNLYDDQPIHNDDELHWQDPEEFGSEFFDMHERQERRQSLHHASPEIFNMAESLHEVHARRLQRVTTEDNEVLSPIHLSSLPPGPFDSTLHRYSGQAQICCAPVPASGRPTNDADSPMASDVHPEEAAQQLNIDHETLRSACFLNRCAPLGRIGCTSSLDDRLVEQQCSATAKSIGSRNVSIADSGYGGDMTSEARIFDQMATDPSIQREQELLWNVLSSRRNMRTDGIRDRKLEIEENKGLYEVLKWEAKQKQRKGVSEETLGMESEIDFGNDSGSGDADEESTQQSDDDEDMEEIQSSWNFGC